MPKYFGTLSQFSESQVYEGGMELLFSHVTPKVLNLANLAANSVFGPQGAPKDLITVHVRWGDKGKEMELVPISAYIATIERLILKHQISSPSVFLTTEDPVALQEFTKAAPKAWKIYMYTPAVSSDASVHSQKHEAEVNGGTSGRHSLVSLLLAMEASHFVVTTGSNWSRLIDELRRTILDRDCGGCTDLEDLQDGRHHFSSGKKPKTGYLRPITDKEHVDPIFGFKAGSR